MCLDAEWERYFCYKNIEVPEVYSGPHLTFPLTVEQAVGLLEAFRNKKVGGKAERRDSNSIFVCGDKPEWAHEAQV